MILVKSNRTKSNKSKILKFDLHTQFEPEEIYLLDPDKIPANTLYKKANENIERINKWLERSRVLKRAIECSFNNNHKDKLKDYPDIKFGRTKGKFVQFLIEGNGIFIH